MKKRLWRRILTAGCVASLLMTSPGMAVLADELPGEEAAVSDSFVDESEPVETAEESVPVGTEEDRAAEEFAIPEEDESGETLEDESVLEEPMLESPKKFDESNGEIKSVEETIEFQENAETIEVPAREEDGIIGDTQEDFDSKEDYYVLDEEVTISTAQEVGANTWMAGDGVTATFNVQSGELVFDSNGGTLWTDWNSKLGIPKDAVRSIEVSDSSTVIYCPEDSSELFRGYINLTHLDLSKFDTSNVTDMSGMFSGCKGLKELNLSNFNTSKVTNMSSMFGGYYWDGGSCESLISLDLSSFNTSNVTDMSAMFYGCSALTYLNINGLDTTNVTSMASMFNGCSNLTSLDLSSFNTSNVVNMDSMFYACRSLTNLDLSGFDTSNVTDMGYMFIGCDSLTKLNVSSFNTSNVTDMSSMFNGCSNLTSVDVSSFNTSNVTDMGYMFSGCNSLKSLDLSSFDMSRVRYAKGMLKFCRDCETLETPSNKRSDGDLATEGDMWAELGSVMVDKEGEEYIKLPDHSDSMTLVKADYVLDGEVVGDGVTATFNNRTGTLSLFSKDGGTLWAVDSDDFEAYEGMIRTIKIDDNSGIIYLPEDSSELFSGWNYLETLDLRGCDTSNVTNMESMFEGCSALTTLDLSEFDTANVTDMGYMFRDCSSLENLDLSSFDTSNVTSMYRMFERCRNLENIDLSSFDTSNVGMMAEMFEDCSSLSELDMSNFDTSSAYDMDFMFSGCSSLTTLDVTKFDTSKLTEMNYLFVDCKGLITLDVSNFDTSNATEIRGLFLGCSNLKNLDVSNFVTSNATDLSSIFGGCSDLTSLDVSGFDTSNVETMEGMFYGCSGLTTLNLNNFDTSKVYDMSSMFEDCTMLEDVDLSSFDTSSMKYMNRMFENCCSLTNLNLSNFDTTNMEGDFYSTFEGCSSLESLDLSSFDLTKIGHYVEAVFGGCNNLKILRTPIIDTISIELPLTMYDKDGNSYTSLPALSESIVLASSQQLAGETSNPVMGIKIDKDTAIIKKGSSEKLIATVLPNTAFNKNLNWTSSDETVAKVDAEGNITTLKVGTADITATTVDGGFTAVCKLIVEAPNASGVKLDKETLTLKRGETGKLTATVEPTDAANKSVTWTSSNKKVATVDSKGNIKTLKVGTANITVKTADGGFTAVCKLTVEAPNASGVKLDKETLTLKRGETGKLTATVEPADAANKSVTWTSSNKKVATVDSKGNIKTLKVGTADITVKTADGGFTAVCKLTVEAPNVSGVKLDKETLTLKRGETGKLTATVEPADAANKSVTWTSSNKKVATVDSKGNIKTLKVGTADITVKAADGGFAAVCKLTVEAPSVSGITLDKESASLLEGDTLQLTAAVAPEDAGNKGLKWSSSDAGVAAVDEKGLVTAVKAGTADITVTTDDGGFTAVCKVEIAKKIEFKDVADEKLWYYDSVYWAVRNNVTSGMGEGTFQPPDVSKLQAKEFTDVSKTAWYYNAVKWAVANKITSGYGTGTFQPNATCNRAMIVTFLANYAKAAGTYKEPTTSASFKDVKAKDWFKKSVDWAVENGITSGYGQGTFSPNVTCNRAMMVTFLKKVAELAER